jgi:cytochrome c oxidase subunit 3
MKSSSGGVFGLQGPWVFVAGLTAVLLVMFGWWRDVIIEAEREKAHTPVVQMHLRYGMILFIASEVMFFVAWFWAYFDVALIKFLPAAHDGLGQVARDQLLGGAWPPAPQAAATAADSPVAQAVPHFTHTFNPWTLPLLNTIILLTSGVTVTWAHHALLHNDRKNLVRGLLLTVLLGGTFTFLQGLEYSHAGFTFGGHIYGSTFFMATGFHGFHVIVGTIFLAVILFRSMAGHFTPKQHFGFEAAAWYWHFVDVVWLFLFASIYVYGAGAHVAAH